jgi:alkyl sulfatase BDS1-like metallo-beta-lactamase superfamily hydrolase
LWFRNPAHAPFTPGYLPVDHPLTGHGTVTIAGMRVGYDHAPSDADDSINFWFPEIGTCVHNSIWPALFNVFPIRGEEYRDPRALIHGIDQIIRWQPACLVGAHGPTLIGEDVIRKAATRYRDSIQFLWDQTVRGINKGWTADELASRVRLPDLYDQDYLTSERYGVAEHHVRQIHNGLRGWFDGEESHLFPLEPLARYGRLIEGFGGRHRVREQVASALDTNDIRWALELATWLVRSAEAEAEDRQLLARGLRLVAERTPAANIRNWALTRARTLDGSTDMRRYYQHRFNSRAINGVPTPEIIALLRVLIEPSGIEGIDHHVAFQVDDVRCGLHIRNGVAVPTEGDGADSTLHLDRETLLRLLSGKSDWVSARSAGRLRIDGDQRLVDRIRAAIEVDGLRSTG